MKTVWTIRRFIHTLPTMTSCNIRWAFNIKNWTPSSEEILKSTTFIQLEEKVRLGRFYFREDFKSSLIGRLLMRKFVSEITNIPYNEIIFKRDGRGKPILANQDCEHIKFNVSHQGDYVVLAGSNDAEALGVDVMKMEYKGGKQLCEFFRIMNRQFTTSEWQTINKGDDNERIKMFTRLWCLKESYVKATGTGLNLDLQKINFQIKHKNLCPNEIIDNTILYVDGEKVDWEFHEMLLDDEHCVAVAIKGSNLTKIYFTELNIAQLLEKGLPLLEEDIQYCNSYLNKMEKS